MHLHFSDHAHKKMQRDRITLQQVYVVISRGRSNPTWKNRRRWSHEIDGRWIVVVTVGKVVVTAFRKR